MCNLICVYILIWHNICSFTQLCLILCDLIDCSPVGTSVCGIFQARVLEWVVISSSRGSSWPRDWTHTPSALALAAGFFTTVPPEKPLIIYMYTHTHTHICFIHTHTQWKIMQHKRMNYILQLELTSNKHSTKERSHTHKFTNDMICFLWISRIDQSIKIESGLVMRREKSGDDWLRCLGYFSGVMRMF